MTNADYMTHRVSDDRDAALADMAAEAEEAQSQLGQDEQVSESLGVAHVEAIAAIRTEQRGGGKAPLAPFKPFAQLLDALALQFNSRPERALRFDPFAVTVVYAALESYLVDVLQEANIEALHSKRGIVWSLDVQVALRVRGDRA